jgi:hypothetical protein
VSSVPPTLHRARASWFLGFPYAANCDNRGMLMSVSVIIE